MRAGRSQVSPGGLLGAARCRTGSMLSAIAAAVVAGLAAAAPDGYAAVASAPAPKLGLTLLSSLPRTTRAFKPSKADVGSYNIFSCTGANDTRSCSLDTTALSASALGSPPPGSLVDYGEGVAIWAGVSIAAAVLAMLGLFVFIVLRYCTCCCCKPNRCSCMRCGAPYPTQKQTCCGCGFRPGGKDGKLGYSRCDRWGARIYMLLFIACAAGLIAASDFVGTQAIPAALASGAATAPDGMMKVATAAMPAVTELIKGLGARVLAPAMRAFNEVRAPRISAFSRCWQTQLHGHHHHPRSAPSACPYTTVAAPRCRPSWAPST